MTLEQVRCSRSMFWQFSMELGSTRALRGECINDTHREALLGVSGSPAAKQLFSEFRWLCCKFRASGNGVWGSRCTCTHDLLSLLAWPAMRRGTSLTYIAVFGFGRARGRGGWGRGSNVSLFPYPILTFWCALGVVRGQRAEHRASQVLLSV